MKKLAIVSSYNELCGNATYTEALKRGFEEFYQVDVIELKVHILNSLSASSKKLAEKHIQEIAEKLKSYDYVNIQFEAGLYGIVAKDIYKRVKCLIDNSRNCVVTLHRFDPPKSSLNRKTIKMLLKFEFTNFFRELIETKKYNHYATLYKKIIKIIKERNASIVVHTERERKIVQSLCGLTRVYDHPISFLTQAQAEQHRKNISKEMFRKKYNLEEADVLVGIFGFISRYKAHDVAIRAISCLPHNYKLLIFGGQHPFSILQNCPVDHFINDLLHLIEVKSKKSMLQPENSFFNRILFLGSVPDNEFINALLNCDIAILPYLETNQSGSGIAGLTLDLGVKAVFSMNYAFLELAKYAPDVFSMFSIGNYLELAQAIKRQHEAPLNQAAYDVYWKKYNLSTSISLYRQIFEGAL